MLDHGDIFIGSTPANLRMYLRAILSHARQHYSRLVIPCCGKFAVAEVAVSAGWLPSQIECSEVSIFTTVLAAHVTGAPLQQTYGPITADGDLGSLDLNDPPTVLFALKLAICRHHAKNFYDECIVRDLERRAAAHIACLKSGMDKIKARLNGMTYRPQDLIEHLTAKASDPKAVIWAAPPSYRGGYEKLYDHGGVIHFPQPTYTEFDPLKGGYAQVRQILANAPALGLRLIMDELQDDEHAEAMCAEADSTIIKYLLTNRPAEVTVWRRKSVFLPKPVDIKPINAPIFTDEREITAETVISFLPITLEQAWYYRDLFAHRLGATLAELHFAFVIDGAIAGIIGLHMQALNLGKPTHNGQLWLEETFCFTAPSYRYPRLNRLLLGCITCTNFFKLLKFNIHRPVGIIRTCLAEHPELKTHRGLLTEISKERQKNGLWKLRACAYWRDESFQTVVTKWLEKHGTEDKARFPTG